MTAAVLLVAMLASGAGATAPASIQTGATVVEHLGESMPLDVPLVNPAGERVTLGQYVDGVHPVILSLVYFRCPMLCSLILSGLTRAMRGMQLDLGKDYRAVTVSFDPSDTPADALAKQRGYESSLGRVANADDWVFLTGTKANVERVTQAAGFGYTWDASTGQFIHPAVVLILSPTGHISRYLYEVSFEPRQLELALTEAAQGKVGTSVDRVLLTCFHYDPATRRYGPWLFGCLRLGGAVVLLALTTLIAVLVRGEVRRSRAHPPGAEATPAVEGGPAP